MFEFKSNIVKTDVTSIKTVGNYILVGIGGFLQVFNKNFLKCLQKHEIFQGENVCTIAANSNNNIAVASGQHVKIFEHDENFETLNEKSYRIVKDWILCMKWINSANIATVLMHNKLQIWNQSLEITTESICEEKCILYSSFIYGERISDLVIFSGTVFCEVLIWKPKQEGKKESCVLKRLVGHKGVIFSIDYNAESGFLCSTSDDCSAILWKIAVEDLENTNVEVPTIQVYGHLSRVFRCQVLREYFVTAGEDSFVNIWSFDGKLLRKIETHQGSSVWSIECIEKDNLVVTGGGDGGVTLYSTTINFCEKKFTLPNNEGPKAIGILKTGNLVVLSDAGTLYWFSQLYENWLLIKKHDDLKNYGLLKISKCRQLVSLSGFNGQIYIYKDEEFGLNFISSYQTKLRTRIFSFHWIACRGFLICQDQGILSLLYVNKTTITHIKNFILPMSKERWTTAAVKMDNYFAVGDRKGNLHLYEISKKHALQTLKKVHNHLGVTNLIVHNKFIVSLGRDSTVKTFSLRGNHLILISSDKLPFSWLLDIVDDILIAFSSNNFIVSHYKTKRTLFEKSCGGGHRSWDFVKNNSNSTFSYIKDKSIYTIGFGLKNIMPSDLIESYHVKEINALNVLQYNNNVVISGGEDTTLRIYLAEDSDFHNLLVLKSHLSSIRAIVSYKLFDSVEDGQEVYLIFSAGGRAQVICWKLEIFLQNNTVQSVLCSEQYSYYKFMGSEESEMRIMDLVITEISGRLLLFCACSDGFVKVFHVHYENELYSLVFCRDIFYDLKCILKLINQNVFENSILISLATDGKLTFWNMSNVIKEKELFPISNIPTHQSGINSCSFKFVDKSLCIILTGGDDNAIVASLIQYQYRQDAVSVELFYRFIDSGTHCAQITGIFLSDKYFVTTSIDQKIVLFKWKLNEKKIDYHILSKYNSSISDIQGMQSFKCKDNYELFIFGNGLEFLKIKNVTT